jgi:putative colanic acid biosynthesis acetyltransferase WcaF
MADRAAGVLTVDLSRYDNSHYRPGAGLARRVLWYICNAAIFDSWLLPSSGVKRCLLRVFGAKVGAGVVIKPRVNIKYPWRLRIGAHSWLGERVWIDNLADVAIGANVCISQGAYLLTGNHDYRDDTFALVTREIRVDDSAWIGAFAIVCPGVSIARRSVLSVGSLATTDTEAGWIYRGSPAAKVRRRHDDALKPAGRDSP